MTNSEIADREARLRDQRDQLRARYDGGAVPAAIFAAIKEIETTISWLQHQTTKGHLK
jgi:hypothetical protein